MYACGVTPYNDCHLGHAKVYSTIDLIVRAMRMTGKKVQLVMNITDIDQKIINKSKELNCYWKDVSRQYEKSFFQDMKKLNVEVPNVVARITDYVPEIVAYIQKIIDNGFAYVTSDGSVYFDSKAYVDAGYVLDMSDPDFDNIDGSDDGLETVDKLPFLGKKNKIDFALWKSRDKEDVGFEAQFKYGDTMIKTYGLIGWHIECSTIIHELIGPDIQVHFGGIDLKFPHHYNEIIQANAYYHPKFHPSWTSLHKWSKNVKITQEFYYNCGRFENNDC
jgi:cysteinyl-tRNA synthetase